LTELLGEGEFIKIKIILVTVSISYYFLKFQGILFQGKCVELIVAKNKNSDVNYTIIL